MLKHIKRCSGWAFAAITFVFTFVPEALFSFKEWLPITFIKSSQWWIDNYKHANLSLNRLIVFGGVWIIAFLISLLMAQCKKKVIIKGDNYLISIEYGDILKVKKCKRVINFDECFTATVGGAPEDINPSSICGQYLASCPNIDMEKLIKESHLKPAKRKSKFNGRDRYESGSLVANGDDLLLAFAPLDKRGRAGFDSLDDYKQSLNLLWKEIDAYQSQEDVCIPILGSGVTRFEGTSGAGIPQQQLLDMIICSYKLSSYKIKKPKKLRIICKKSKDFSLEKINA